MPAIWARLAMTMTSAATMPQPPIQPDARAERLGRPGERRAAVGGDPVELAVGLRDEEHRDEREDHDRSGAWKPTRATTKPRVAARE